MSEFDKDGGVSIPLTFYCALATLEAESVMGTSGTGTSETIGREGLGSDPHRRVTHPGGERVSPEREVEHLMHVLRTSPDVRRAILTIVSHEMRRQVEGSEQRMSAHLESLTRRVKSGIAEAVGSTLMTLGDSGRRAASNVAGYPRSFKFALFAVFALFCAVSYLCVEHARGAMVRAEERAAMHELLDEARTSVAQVAGAQGDIAMHGQAISGLLDATERNTAFRQSYEQFDFPAQIDDIQTQLGVLQLEVANLREDTHARLRLYRRDVQTVERRVAPIEAVTLTNRTRYYRGPLDEMASTRCTEAKRSASRASPDFHVRACTDGYNGQEYLLWCAEEHQGALESERFSGCTSTDPYHRS